MMNMWQTYTTKLVNPYEKTYTKKDMAEYVDRIINLIGNKHTKGRDIEIAKSIFEIHYE